MVQNEELMHYGVVGMKRGVRRGNVVGSYSKATKKLNKLQSKANKAYDKRMKRSNPLIRTEISDARYANAVRKADKAQRKADVWKKKMDKIFKDINVNSISEEAISKGMKYTKKLES